MSYNPSTGLVYIPSFYTNFPLQAQAEYRPGTTGYVRPRGDTRVVEPVLGPEPPPTARGGLQGWDPVTQQLRWHVENGGGTTTTAGNLVFQVINDGRFRALRADAGEILHEVRTNRQGAAPPVTYAIDGRQYAAFASGLGRSAANVGPTDAEVEYPPLLFVFTLGGTDPYDAPEADRAAFRRWRKVLDVAPTAGAGRLRRRRVHASRRAPAVPLRTRPYRPCRTRCPRRR